MRINTGNAICAASLARVYSVHSGFLGLQASKLAVNVPLLTTCMKSLLSQSSTPKKGPTHIQATPRVGVAAWGLCLAAQPPEPAEPP